MPPSGPIPPRLVRPKGPLALFPNFRQTAVTCHSIPAAAAEQPTNKSYPRPNVPEGGWEAEQALVPYQTH